MLIAYYNPLWHIMTYFNILQPMRTYGWTHELGCTSSKYTILKAHCQSHARYWRCAPQRFCMWAKGWWNWAKFGSKHWEPTWSWLVFWGSKNPFALDCSNHNMDVFIPKNIACVCRSWSTARDSSVLLQSQYHPVSAGSSGVTFSGVQRSMESMDCWREENGPGVANGGDQVFAGDIIGNERIWRCDVYVTLYTAFI